MPNKDFKRNQWRSARFVNFLTDLSLTTSGVGQNGDKLCCRRRKLNSVMYNGQDFSLILNIVCIQTAPSAEEALPRVISSTLTKFEFNLKTDFSAIQEKDRWADTFLDFIERYLKGIYVSVVFCLRLYRRFAASGAMTAEEQEQHILYTNVLEYEQDHVSLSNLLKDITCSQSSNQCL